jgi:anti-sigma regulatory factor (Ser/Thr protein kinase)
VTTIIPLGASAGTRDGYAKNFPLERDLSVPIVVDGTRLDQAHPMFLVRLRLFVDWHLDAGHDVVVKPPIGPAAAQQWADMAVTSAWPASVANGTLLSPGGAPMLLPIKRLTSWHDVEDAAAIGAEVLGQQAPALAVWGEAAHMAIGELCDNAIQHGHNELGAYVAADHVSEPQPCFRLVVADLGIGIPEHIRAQHPEWQDDTAAITRALDRGITGTGDRHRGNGIAEVLDRGHAAQLRRAMSELSLDIRSARGRVRVRVVDGQQIIDGPPTATARRGTWISYEVRTVC